ncbi:MAG: hypothetical protein JXA78_04785, partial [Anaerolineales bacterium]|nr:hypothetical protein [Anaerolineales bacterium]
LLPDARPLNIPLQVRGQVIGSLDAWPQDRDFTDDEIYLLTIISSRISQILESAHLFEETRVRAAHEETINRLTASIARALDVDSVMQAAARELGSLPAVVEAMVYLGSASSDAGPFLSQTLTSQKQDGNGAGAKPPDSAAESKTRSARSGDGGQGGLLP